MSDKTSIGDRMKGYERVTDHRLVPRQPVIIRVDGRAFHSLTRYMNKPFDDRFQRCMQQTAKFLCEQISGVRFAYSQSDEISLLVTDYRTIKTHAWFDYRLQKVCSIAAALASVQFSERLATRFPDLKVNYHGFDARAFNIPRAEVVNYFIWRQQDAVRNSIQGLGQALFSHNELLGKSCDQIQEMLFQHKDINWNDQLPADKRGFCVILRPCKTGHSPFMVDFTIPTFTQNRDYIQQHVDIEED